MRKQCKDGFSVGVSEFIAQLAVQTFPSTIMIGHFLTDEGNDTR